MTNECCDEFTFSTKFSERHEERKIIDFSFANIEMEWRRLSSVHLMVRFCTLALLYFCTSADEFNRHFSEGSISLAQFISFICFLPKNKNAVETGTKFIRLTIKLSVEFFFRFSIVNEIKYEKFRWNRQENHFLFVLTFNFVR